MKLTVFLLTAVFLQVSARGLSQTVTFSGQHVTLHQVFSAVKKQTGYAVMYKADLLDKLAPASISATNVPLERFLGQVLRDQQLDFSIKNTTIFIFRKAADPSSGQPGSNGTADHSLDSLPKGKEVRGRITNTRGEALSDVTIESKNGHQETFTDANGYFTLKNVDEHTTIVISMVGYEKKEVMATRQIGEIRLSISVSVLDQVQLIGYGSTSKRYNTGDVTTVKGEDIKNEPVISPLQALEGMVPGLFIQQGNGMPGAASKVLLRGTNSITSGTVPLYIIDGVPFDGNPVDKGGGVFNANQPNGETDPLNAINPGDIESIDVLKDADATSIYGSRGANGVIIITTKHAKGGKTGVSANVYTGFSKAIKLLPTLNTSQYLAIRKQAFANDNITPTAANAPDLLVWSPTANTDYEKMLIGNTAHTTDASLSMAGGDANNGFLLSGAYHDESTVMPGDFGYHRGSLHAKSYHTSPNGKLKGEFTVIYSAEKNKLPSTDITAASTSYPDNYPLYNPDGSLYFNSNFTYNPLSLLRNYYKTATTDLLLNAAVSYNILPNLKVKLNAGEDVISLTSLAIYPKSALNPATASTANSEGLYDNNSTTTYIAEPQIDYNTAIGKGKLGVTAGGTYQYRDYEEPYAVVASGFASDALIENFGSAGTIFQNKDYSSQYNYASLFGRLNYNWNGRYILSSTFRRDGSSKFGPGKQYGNFGSAGAAWLFTEESFMKDQKWLSFGKLRGSYGTVGNDQIANYGYLDSYSTSGTAYGTTAGTVPSRIANPNFSWETTKKLESGLELGFFNNNLLVNTAWFRNRSGNLLVSYPLTGQTGFTSYTANLNATVQNTGWELEIKATPVTTRAFTWNVAFNISTSQNKLVAYPGLIKSTYANKYIVGQPLNLMALYEFTGFVNGVAQVADVNKDGRISAGLNANGNGDYINAGTTDPKFYGGFSNSLRYSNFQLDLLFNFVKQKGYAPTTFPGLLGNQYRDVLNSPFKASTTSASASYVSYANYYVYSNAKVQDASFIRLRNVSLSYNLPQRWQKAIKFSNCRLYISAQNLLTVTHYKGFDPETSVYNPVGFPTPLPASVFPPLKVITGGISISL